MYDVTAAPSTTALTTLENVKDEMGICLDETATDPRLQRLIQRASDAIVARLSRPLARHTITELLPWTGQRRQWLHVAPIVSITSVKLNGNVIPVAEYQVDRRAGSVFRDGGWMSNMLTGFGATQFPTAERGKSVYEFVYVAGYYLPTFAINPDLAITAADWRLPADLEAAAIALVRHYWNQAKRNLQVIGESLGDYSVQYTNPVSLTAGTEPQLPDEVEVMLKPYTRIVVR